MNTNNTHERGHCVPCLLNYHFVGGGACCDLKKSNGLSNTSAGVPKHTIAPALHERFLLIDFVSAS